MSKQSAFTLIELLVVVAIIALLISILLPSIEAARAQAQAVVCSAHLKDINNGFNNYANQFQDWIPGSPGTSAGDLAYNLPDFPDGASIDTPGVPVQNWDWQTPLAFYGLGFDNLPTDRNERWKYIREMKLLTCPSNNFLATPYPIGEANNGWPVILMNSYSTIREFMYFGYQEDGGQPGVNIPPNWDVHTPAGHAPRFTNVQRPSAKGLIVEGSRYMTQDVPAPDYAVDYNAGFGGSFATAGPSSSWSRSFVNPVVLESGQDPKWDRYTYRHPVAGDPGFNTLFFDGHVERMTKTTAIETVDFWLPSDTKVQIGEFDGSGGGSVEKPRAMRTMEKRIPDDDDFYDIY